MEKPCELCLTMDEFYKKIEKMPIDTYLVELWYKQGNNYEPETLSVIYDWDNKTNSYWWSWDWDEGGVAFVLGFDAIDHIDLAGRNI